MSVATTTKYEMFQLLEFNRDVQKTRKCSTLLPCRGLGRILCACRRLLNFQQTSQSPDFLQS